MLNFMLENSDELIVATFSRGNMKNSCQAKILNEYKDVKKYLQN